MRPRLLHWWLWHTDTDYRIFLDYRKAIIRNEDELITGFYEVTLSRLMNDVGAARVAQWWKAMPR